MVSIPCRQAGVREPGREQLAKAEVYKFPPRAGEQSLQVSLLRVIPQPLAGVGHPQDRPGWV